MATLYGQLFGLRGSVDAVRTQTHFPFVTDPPDRSQKVLTHVAPPTPHHSIHLFQEMNFLSLSLFT